MALLGKVEKGQLERMLSNVATLALWELGATNGVTDDDAALACIEIADWLGPIADHFERVLPKK